MGIDRKSKEQIIREHMSEIGRKGGQKKSLKKTMANREKGIKQMKEKKKNS